MQTDEALGMSSAFEAAAGAAVQDAIEAISVEPKIADDLNAEQLASVEGHR